MRPLHAVTLLCLLCATRVAALDLTEFLDELTNVDFKVIAEVTGADETELRSAVLDLPAALVEEGILKPPPLELPMKPPEPVQTLWPRPGQQDWPVGAYLYVRQLKRIFQDEGVPAELVWIAEVESGFEPWARSRVGAAGLYQLMPETAELLGLSLKPADERFVPAKSGRAAARYLKYLRAKFPDWQLTLAAYNGGEGRVRRLLDQSRAHTFDQIALRLPPETQMYVPKVEATILRREGVTLSELKAE